MRAQRHRRTPPRIAPIAPITRIGPIAHAVLLALVLHGRDCRAGPGAADAPADAADPSMQGMDMAPEPAPMVMAGMYGPYAMARESSGTSWQPDSTPLDGVHDMAGRWMTMWHGFANLVFDDQGGPRGGAKTFSDSMLMFMGRRQLDDGAAAGFRLMGSADPLMGRDGYPELFQTGETADGVHPLVDRQHPHNLLMEAAASYSAKLSAGSAVFAYAGLAGEPALGPPAFMHRYSGMDNPEAPLSHHWLDSTHISYGVATGGYVQGDAKIEASVFNGREPGQNRYDVALRHLDSFCARVSWNPLADVALQVSSGRLASPEQLQPQTAVVRSTASASANHAGEGYASQTTLAWGRDSLQPGIASNAWLLESAWVLGDTHTFLARAERVTKPDLFVPGQPLYGAAFTIDSLSLGYIHDFARLDAARVGAGVLGTAYRYPAALVPSYGNGPLSYLVFLRIRL